MHFFNRLNITLCAIIFCSAITASCQDNENSDTKTLVDTSTVTPTPLKVDIFDTLFSNTKTYLSDGFDMPVGKPNARHYYCAQKFNEINNSFGGTRHLGEDWNGNGGGNTDLGDPVYSISNGYVNFAEDYGPGWGNVVKITHKIQLQDTTYFVESLYGHLDTIMVKPGTFIKRGEQLGTIGNADGAYWAHLHLELRSGPEHEVGGGYEMEAPNWLLDPTNFILGHRKFVP